MAHYHDEALKEVAVETQRILAAGGYTHKSGTEVRFGDAIAHAVKHTVTLSPQQTNTMLATYGARAIEFGQASAPAVKVEVTGETSQQAAHRLVVKEGTEHIVVLNFASALKPGGGFLSGARAQEEDLARCSALHPCLIEQNVPGGFYAQHRAARTHLYSDAAIYSPAVPFFRVRSKSRLDHVYPAGVLTMAAPHMRKLEKKRDDAAAVVESTFRKRVGAMFAVAQSNAHRTLVLGAWGCGVFGCDPDMVASSFRRWLDGCFAGAFDRVVFPIYDPRPHQPLRHTFESHLTT